MRTTDSPTGTLLGDRYLLTRPLGAGASATVYLAEDRSLRREVALKVLRTGLTHDDAFLKRFRAEAVAVAGLNHPHVLRVFDWGESGEQAWLVTEYLAGGSVRELLDAKGRLAPELVVSIGAQAADGLAYAHARGFVHRDVKPSNLLFDDAGRVRVTDFGVARALAEAAWTEPSGGLIGTVRYTSPEQAQGRPVDGKSDVYSLALVLYECVTGELPFAADTQVATLNARIGAPPPTHPDLGALAGVLHDALASDPAERLDAESLCTRLTDLARTLPDPPPLRGPRHLVGFRPPTAQELTGQHRTVGPARPATRRDHDAPPRHAAPDTTLIGEVAMVDATVAGTTSDRTVVATVPEAEVTGDAVGAGRPPRAARQARPHRRRWPVVVVVLALALGGGAYAVAGRGSNPPPRYRVPSIVGRNVNVVRRILARDHFVLKIDRFPNSTRWPPGFITAQRPRPGHTLPAGSVIHVLSSAGPPPVAISAVIGRPCATAVAILTAEHFTARCPAALGQYSTGIPAGEVVAVYSGNVPNPSAAAYGSLLRLALSKGRPPVAVPNVVGYAGLQALSALRTAGFQPVVERAYSRTVHAGNVISTSPSSTTTLQPGKPITVVVSKGAPATVPALGKLGLAGAEQRLIAAGLTVAGYHGPRSATGWTTQPPAGTVVSVGTPITLYAT